VRGPEGVGLRALGLEGHIGEKINLLKGLIDIIMYCIWYIVCSVSVCNLLEGE
jgi:hypothetical protein